MSEGPSTHFLRHIASVDRQAQVNIVHKLVTGYATNHPDFSIGQLVNLMDEWERVAINVAIHSTTRMSGIQVDADEVTAFLLGHPMVETPPRMPMTYDVFNEIKSKPLTLSAAAA